MLLRLAYLGVTNAFAIEVQQREVITFQ